MSKPAELVHDWTQNVEQLYRDNKIDELVKLYHPDAKMMPPDHQILIGREGKHGFKPYDQSNYYNYFQQSKSIYKRCVIHIPKEWVLLIKR